MDPTKDWLLRTIITLTQGLSNQLSKGVRTEIPRPNNAVGDDEILPEILNEMIRAGKIDEAENLLFRCVENLPLTENYAIGLGFYETLSLLSDEELRISGWSRREIKEGIADLHRAVFHETPDFFEED
ncbi:MAG: DUF6483 family protein [Clostridia bacterium]